MVAAARRARSFGRREDHSRRSRLWKGLLSGDRSRSSDPHEARPPDHAPEAIGESAGYLRRKSRLPGQCVADGRSSTGLDGAETDALTTRCCTRAACSTGRPRPAQRTSTPRAVWATRSRSCSPSLVAACGVLPMVSGRGLGTREGRSTSSKRFPDSRRRCRTKCAQLDRLGIVMVGQGPDLRRPTDCSTRCVT